MELAVAGAGGGHRRGRARAPGDLVAPGQALVELEDRDGERAADVTVVEVGPRDGLQNEAAIVPAAAKIAADRARWPPPACRSSRRPRSSRRARCPQLADADEVLRGVRRRAGVRYPVLVPNMRGLERAHAAGADADGGLHGRLGVVHAGEHRR